MLFGAGLLGGVVVGWFVRFPPSDSASAASWVQAIGAAVGIGVAIYIPFRQRREDQCLRQLEYWSRRAEIEYRIGIVTDDVMAYVDRLIDEAGPVNTGIKLAAYYPTLHQQHLDRIAALEVHDIGISGHDRVKAMREVLTDLRTIYPLHMPIQIDPNNSDLQRRLEVEITPRARACAEATQNNIQQARAKLDVLEQQ
ncbi:hypothetical protein [Paraburkholderia dipogonis]|uniref:hypothetical protein n=1 Tax=Paraburkholderia dipogonis TaxID=1211383 RepID=UPI0038B895D9